MSEQCVRPSIDNSKNSANLGHFWHFWQVMFVLFLSLARYSPSDVNRANSQSPTGRSIHPRETCSGDDLTGWMMTVAATTGPYGSHARSCVAIGPGARCQSRHAAMDDCASRRRPGWPALTAHSFHFSIARWVTWKVAFKAQSSHCQELSGTYAHHSSRSVQTQKYK